MARDRSVLAAVALAQGDCAEAQQLWQQALQSELGRQGRDHPQVALYRANLARVLSVQGDSSAATEPLREAVRAARLQPEGSRFRIAIERAAREILGATAMGPFSEA